FMIGLRKSILSGHCPLFFCLHSGAALTAMQRKRSPTAARPVQADWHNHRNSTQQKSPLPCSNGLFRVLQQLKLLSAVLDDVISSSCYRTIDQFHISHGSVIASTETTFHNANVATRTGLVTRAQFSEQLAYCFFATGTSKGQTTISN